METMTQQTQGQVSTATTGAAKSATLKLAPKVKDTIRKVNALYKAKAKPKAKPKAKAKAKAKKVPTANATRVAAAKARVTAPAVLTKKWGPFKTIVRVLKKRAKSQRVLLSCKHEATLALGATKRARCGACMRRAAK